jgi:hypothetical protein
MVAWVIYSVVVWNPVFIIGEGIDMVMWSVILAIAVINIRKQRLKA